MNKLVLAAMFFACASPTLAQQISGQVRYFDSGQAALNILVKCDGTGGRSEDFTDRSGNFRFRVSPGHYTVSIHIPGYMAEERSVDLVDNSSSEYMLFRLRPEAKPPTKTGVISSSIPPEAQKEFEAAEAALSSDKKEKIGEGIKHLTKALSLYPNFVEAELMLGTAYMDLGEWDKAEQALRKTSEMAPKAANAFFALGEVYLHQKKDDEAEKALLQGLQIEDRSYKAHLTLGRVYWDRALRIKDAGAARPLLEKSYEQVKKALDLNPDLAEAHLLKGNLYLRVQRAADAQHEFEEYLRLEPKGPAAEQARATVEKLKRTLTPKKN